MQTRLSKTGIKAISAEVDLLFAKVKARLLGPAAPGIDGKRLAFQFDPRTSLSALYTEASRVEGVAPRDEILRHLLSIAGSYVDAHKERTKAKVLHEVQGFLADAQSKGVETDFETVLGGKLAEVMGDLRYDVSRIVETEATNTRNTSIFDAIGRVGASVGREDPTVFFVCAHSPQPCDECKRLHLMEDLVTPRLWRSSELGSGYHKRGDSTPKVGGLHPNCFTASQRLFTGAGIATFGELYANQSSAGVVVDSRVKNRRAGGNQFGEPIPGDVWLYRHASGSKVLDASAVYSTGVQGCLRISLENGLEIEVSRGHEMWVDNDNSATKIRADEVGVGDKIPVLSGEGAWGADSFPVEAELMGNLLGDGSLSCGTAVWHFFGDDIPYGEELYRKARTLTDWGNKEYSYTVTPPGSKYDVSSTVFNSTVLARRFVNEFGLSKKPRRIPARVWTSTKETASAFLRGLFAADGCSDRTPSIILGQNDREFLAEIQVLLLNFGLRSRVRPQDPEHDKEIVYADGSVHMTHRKATWKLVLGGWDQCAKFADEIGMGVPRKQAQLLERLALTSGKKKLGAWRTARVAAIEDIGEQQTYCLTEPMTNTVTVNGIVTGQCRCVLTHLLPGFGFDAQGHVEYVSEGHDELAKQRGL
jgi:hypothetical protein